VTPLLHADVGLWPVLIFWAVFVLFARNTKRRTPPRPPASGGGAPSAQPGLLGELKKAMEELQAVERAERQRTAAGRQATADLAELRRTEQQLSAHTPKRPLTRQQAKSYVSQAFSPRGRGVKRGGLVFPDDDADKTSEAGPLSTEDYDEEAEQVIQARLKAADRGIRGDQSIMGLSKAQLSRRASREAVAIGGRAEHAEWHDAIGSAAPVAPKSTTLSALDRLAKGGARGAVILGELLGRPVGERMRDD